MKVFHVYAEDYNAKLVAIHQREWTADWAAYKEACKYSNTPLGATPEFGPRYISNPIWGHPGWGFGPYSDEAYTYVVPVKVQVP